MNIFQKTFKGLFPNVYRRAEINTDAMELANKQGKSLLQSNILARELLTKKASEGGKQQTNAVLFASLIFLPFLIIFILKNNQHD